MIKTQENILPIRGMTNENWKKIHSGFVITGSRDWLVPQENAFGEQIIEYLLNTELSLSNYTKYDKFCFHVTTYIAEPFFRHPEGIKLVDEYDITWINLEVYMPDAKRFAKVNKHEAFRMIAQLLLDSIPKYLFDRDDFDGKKFYEDILPIVQPIADGTRTFREEEFPL